MLVHYFRRIFPYVCDSQGQLKEGVLNKADSSFESYNEDSVPVIGHTLVHTMNISTKKFILTRLYVIAREEGSILLSN